MFSAGVQNNRVFIMVCPYRCVSVLSSYPLHHLPLPPFYPLHSSLFLDTCCLSCNIFLYHLSIIYLLSIYIYLIYHLYVYLSIICLSMYLSIYLLYLSSIYLSSIYVSIYLSIYLSIIYLSNYLIYLSICIDQLDKNM